MAESPLSKYASLEVAINAVYRRRGVDRTLEYWSMVWRATESATYVMRENSLGCHPQSVEIGTATRLFVKGNPATKHWYFGNLSVWTAFNLFRVLKDLVLCVKSIVIS